MSTHDQRSAPADTLRAALGEASLDAMLQSARALFMRNPGDEATKRVVEALELFMSQVWFGGTDEGQSDPRYADAARYLEELSFESALALYEALEAEGPQPDNPARRLARQARLVIAARAGAELPPPTVRPPSVPVPPVAVPPAPVPVPPAPVFDDDDDITRIAEEGELPLGAFASEDEVTRVASEAELPLEELRREMERKAEAERQEVERAGAPTEEPPAELDPLADVAPLAPSTETPAPAEADAELEREASAETPAPAEADAELEREASAETPAPAEADAASEPAGRDPSTRAAVRGASALRVPAQTEMRIPRAAPPRIATEASFTPLPSLPAPIEPPLGRAPAPVDPNAPADARAPLADAGPSHPDAPHPAPSVANAPPEAAADHRASPASIPPAGKFKGIVKDAPRSTLPSVPPPVVHAPEVAPRGTVPPAPPKPPPAEREMPFPSKGGEPRSAPPPPALLESDALRPRGPAVPPPPAALREPTSAPLTGEGVHAPLDTGEITLPEAGGWTIREPGADDDEPTIGEPSWVGVPADDAPPAFEPAAAPIEVDTWDDPTAAGAGASVATAEALVASGKLAEALRMYQELALSQPERPELWDRVAEIARLLQSRQP